MWLRRCAAFCWLLLLQQCVNSHPLGKHEVRLSTSASLVLPNEVDRVARVGEQFNISCHFHPSTGGLIGWTVPDNLNSFLTLAEERLKRVDQKTASHYSSTLVISDAKIQDTGLYKCFASSSPSVSAQRHIFVASDDELVFINDNVEDLVYRPDLHSSLTVACLPTHPDVVVSLVRLPIKTPHNLTIDDRGDLLLSHRVTGWSFDPYRGLTVAGVSLHTHGSYVCQGKRDQLETSKEFSIQVAGLEVMAVPERPHEGDNVTLRCRGYMTEEPEWTFSDVDHTERPLNGNSTSMRVTAKLVKYSIPDVHETLVLLTNFTAGQGGQYVCRAPSVTAVDDYFLPTKSAGIVPLSYEKSIFLQVHARQLATAIDDFEP